MSNPMTQSQIDEAVKLAKSIIGMPTQWRKERAFLDATALARAVLALHTENERLTALIRQIPAYTKHGPDGRGGEGPCPRTCVKCMAEAEMNGEHPLPWQRLAEAERDQLRAALTEALDQWETTLRNDPYVGANDPAWDRPAELRKLAVKP